MLQRIQTIWLSALAILSLSLFKGGIIQFNHGDGTIFTLGFSGISRDTGGISEVVSGSIGLPLTILLITALALTTIFLYKKIRLQKTLTLIIIGFTICLLVITVYYWFVISSRFGGVAVPGIKMAFQPVMLVLALLAYRGIAKDERLLKSYDRLR